MPFDFTDEEDAEVIDGEVTHRFGTVNVQPHTTSPGTVMFNPPAGGYPDTNPATATGTGVGPVVPSDVAAKILELASDQRSRAIALFVEVPFLAFVAFSPKVPGLLRVGAAALGFVRAVEVAQRQRELESYFPELT